MSEQKKPRGILRILFLLVLAAFAVFSLLRQGAFQEDPAGSAASQEEAAEPAQTSQESQAPQESQTPQESQAPQESQTSQEQDLFAPQAEEGTGSVQAGDATALVTLAPSYDGVRITVTAQGGALEGFSVSGRASTGEDLSGTLEEKIPDGQSRILLLDVPMEKCRETYEIRVDVTGEDGRSFSSGAISASLTYTEDKLSELHWNRGTFDEIADSLDYHYHKHHEEIDAFNLRDYLEASSICRDEAVHSPDDFKVTKSSGSLEAHKYKNYDDQRFIILTDDGYEILSFGR